MEGDNGKLDRAMFPYDAMGDYSAFLKTKASKDEQPDEDLQTTKQNKS